LRLREAKRMCKELKLLKELGKLKLMNKRNRDYSRKRRKELGSVRRKV
jgi:hypothetical protein